MGNIVDRIGSLETHHLIYSKPYGQVGPVLEFLNTHLRPHNGFSVKEEYPSIFGTHPGGESLYLTAQRQIVSHVAFLVRDFLHPHAAFKVGMIGSVLTDPRFRGRGLAAQLIRTALYRLQRQGAVLSLLWSDAPSFYESFGFFRAGREVDLRFSASARPLSGPAARAFVKERDIRDSWDLYRQQPMKIDRSFEEHGELVSVPQSRIFVTERDGKISSYIAVNKGADFEGYIHEWAGEVNAVACNVAWVQREIFPNRELTLIAPPDYNLSPLQSLAVKQGFGVLGSIKLMNGERLVATYTKFLNSIGKECSWDKSTKILTVEDRNFALLCDLDYLKVILGGIAGMSRDHAYLPFFLWGFDSI